MSRSTIDFGIDLGTTNSAIAVLNGVAPQIIKNTDDQDITPSAVFINKQGVIRVGTGAKSAFIGERSHRDAYTEFKRMMGTPHEYEFLSSAQRRKPEELSAEVLKELRASVQSRTDEIIQSAVITVPAAFELHQCDATRRAAELAGFKSSPLLQEPVAAALAYGFQMDSEKAYWMVYDFGGGTFDAALIKAEDGMINVVHHGGDNFLGGSDIDWAVIEKVIIPRLSANYNLPGFARGSDRWKLQIMRIKHAVEAAKLELSTKEITTLSGGIAFEDESGETVECDDISLTRNDLIQVAEPLIHRSIDISQRVLREKNLGLHAVQRVIVVGGPTKAPYFREMLSSGLGIPIDFSQDPLTVVSRGAAVFASTQKLDSGLRKKATIGEYQVQISDKYKHVGHENDPLIAGIVISADATPASGHLLEFVNRNTKWRSGQIPLNADGAFMANLLAERGTRNTFHIELSDHHGNLQKTVPDHVVYTIGAVIEEQPLLKSIGIAKADNTVDWLFKAGTGLPQKKRAPIYRTTVSMKAGEAVAGNRFSVVEGEMEYADRNRVVGYLNIDSTKIRRDLPAGSEVEITLKISESRTIVLDAYFPLLDEEFSEQLKLEIQSTEVDDIIAKFKEEQQRLEKLLRQALQSENHNVLTDLEKLKNDKDREEAVNAAAGDSGAAEKARARLVEFQNEIDVAEEKLEWPNLVTEARTIQADLRGVTEKCQYPHLRESAEEWSETVDHIIEKKQTERLQKKVKDGYQIYYQILGTFSSYWVNLFQQLENNKPSYQNPAEAERLYERGRNYLRQNNAEGLQDVVRKLFQLLPPAEVKKQQRGVGSTII